MKKVVFDIEADGLLDTITTIHCIACLDVTSGEEVQFTPDTLHEFQDYLDTCTIIIGHNIVCYDVPALERVLGITFKQEVVDTLILSKLLNPDRGGHSLGWWGESLGNSKTDYNDWTRFSEEMLEYCIQDVRVNRDVYQALCREAGRWDWRPAYQLELKVAQVIQKQEEHGVLFNKELAESCHIELNGYLQEIVDKVEPLLPMRKIPASRLKVPPKKRFIKDGSPSSLSKRYFGDRLFSIEDRWYVTYPDGLDIPLEEATSPMVTHEPMKLADQASMKEWLQTEGWMPTIWNLRLNKTSGKKERTSPKFSDAAKNICPNLLKLGSKVEFIKDVTVWLSYRNRRNVILSSNGTGWLANDRLEKDRRLSASADTLGTNTGRFAHRVVANVPRVSSLYGGNMRSLFTVPDDYYMVGWDASGLESRIEGHYTYKYDGGEYAKELLDGDIHSKNAEVFGCDRDTAKTVKYAVTLN